MNSTNILESFRTQKYLAAVLVVTLLTWMFGVPAWKHTANAASLTDVSDVLTDSDLGVVSNHTISFTMPNGVSAGQTITITFPAGFNLGLISFNDFDLTDDGADLPLAATAAGATWGVATSSQVITLTNGTTVVASSSAMVVQIGTNATFGVTGDDQIVNQTSAGSYVISIAGTVPDSASTRIVIVDNVVVTASVDTVFDFTVSAVNASSTVNGSATTTTATTTATTMPFGTLTPGSSKTLAQDLTVTTNAKQGFSVTVQQNQNLLSSTGADIDGFINGAYTDTPSAWQAPSAVLGSENTYGHLAMTSNDSDVFGSDLWIAASTTARQIMTWTGATNATTTRFGLQVGISALQEAGTDYTNTLTYIATPTF